jgi:DNA (cytosine-5)-methyltransferase 1
MVGNAVPVMLAKILAEKIFVDVKKYLELGFCNALPKKDIPRQLTLF